MKKVVRYFLTIAVIISSLAFVVNFSRDQKRVSLIRGDLQKFSIEAAKLPFSSDWREFIGEDRYPNLDYTKLEFFSVLRESLPKGTPFIVYRDVDRTYNVWLDGHIDIQQNAP